MNNHKLRRYYLEKDYNCAETILRAANEEYHLGLNEDSFRLVSGFGGGMGCGGTCGALSSAMAVISMLQRKGSKKSVQTSARRSRESWEAQNVPY